MSAKQAFGIRINHQTYASWFFFPQSFQPCATFVTVLLVQKAPLRISPHAGFVFFICWKWKKLPPLYVQKSQEGE
ncbi:MAG: hypothetical protein RSA55_00365 [Clostridia bacterium]